MRRLRKIRLPFPRTAVRFADDDSSNARISGFTREVKRVDAAMARIGDVLTTVHNAREWCAMLFATTDLDARRSSPTLPLPGRAGPGASGDGVA